MIKLDLSYLVYENHDITYSELTMPTGDVIVRFIYSTVQFWTFSKWRKIMYDEKESETKFVFGIVLPDKKTKNTTGLAPNLICNRVLQIWLWLDFGLFHWQQYQFLLSSIKNCIKALRFLLCVFFSYFI